MIIWQRYICSFNQSYFGPINEYLMFVSLVIKKIITLQVNLDTHQQRINSQLQLQVTKGDKVRKIAVTFDGITYYLYFYYSLINKYFSLFISFFSRCYFLPKSATISANPIFNIAARSGDLLLKVEPCSDILSREAHLLPGDRFPWIFRYMMSSRKYMLYFYYENVTKLKNVP